MVVSRKIEFSGSRGRPWGCQWPTQEGGVVGARTHIKYGPRDFHKNFIKSIAKGDKKCFALRGDVTDVRSTLTELLQYMITPHIPPPTSPLLDTPLEGEMWQWTKSEKANSI